MDNEELASVRERLEKLKKEHKSVPKPLDEIPDRNRPVGDNMFTFERMFQQKIEKAIRKIENMKERMKTSENFVNYFYDLKQAENEFLELLSKAEEKHVDFPDNFIQRISSIKDKIRSKIR